MKNKGFTLVEVLAMLVVLGIIVGITMPNITGILGNQKINAWSDDAENMINSAKTEVSTNNKIKLPKESNNCIVLPLALIDKNSDIKEDPDGEEYDRYSSFVLVMLKDRQYLYYVRLVANRTNVTNEHYGILGATESDLSGDDTSYIGEIKSGDYTSITKSDVNVSFNSGDKFRAMCNNTIIVSN